MSTLSYLIKKAKSTGSLQGRLTKMDIKKETAIRNLSKLEYLEHIKLYRTFFDDLKWMENMQFVYSILLIGEGEKLKLDGINREIRFVDLSGVDIEDDMPLSNLQKVTWIGLKNISNLTSIEGIAMCNKLTVLSLNNVPIEDLTPIIKTKSLNKVYLENMKHSAIRSVLNISFRVRYSDYGEVYSDIKRKGMPQIQVVFKEEEYNNFMEPALRPVKEHNIINL